MDLLDRTLANQAGFELLSEPIVGGQSCVYRAYHAGTDCDVALKVFHSTDNNKQVLREAAALAALNHPNVAGFVGVGYIDTLPYVASQWIEGKRLSDLLCEHPITSIEQALAISGDIADGLKAAHSLNIVHGDISAANIIIKQDGRAVLIDFGLGQNKNQTTLTVDSAFAGTLRYVAPETIKGTPPGFASDQYALGVLTYELIAGKWPYDHANNLPSTNQYALSAATALHHHLYTTPIPLIEQCPQVNCALDLAVSTAIAKEPAERFQSVAHFNEALRNSSQLNTAPGLNADKHQQSQRQRIIRPAFAIGILISTLAGTGVLVGYASTKGYLSIESSSTEITDADVKRVQQAALVLNNDKSDSTEAQARRVSESSCNMMPNPGFDIAVTDNFYKDPNAPDAVQQFHDPEISSSPLLQIGDANKYGLYGKIVPIKSNDTFVFTAELYTSEGVQRAELSVSWLDQHWQPIDGEQRVMRVENAGGYTEFSNIIAPSNAHFAVPTVFKDASSGTLIVDNLSFTTSNPQCDKTSAMKQEI